MSEHMSPQSEGVQRFQEVTTLVETAGQARACDVFRRFVQEHGALASAEYPDIIGSAGYKSDRNEYFGRVDPVRVGVHFQGSRLEIFASFPSGMWVHLMGNAVEEYLTILGQDHETEEQTEN